MLAKLNEISSLRVLNQSNPRSFSACRTVESFEFACETSLSKSIIEKQFMAICSSALTLFIMSVITAFHLFGFASN